MRPNFEELSEFKIAGRTNPDEGRGLKRLRLKSFEELSEFKIAGRTKLLVELRNMIDLLIKKN